MLALLLLFFVIGSKEQLVFQQGSSDILFDRGLQRYRDHIESFDADIPRAKFRVSLKHVFHHETAKEGKESFGMANFPVDRALIVPDSVMDVGSVLQQTLQRDILLPDPWDLETVTSLAKMSFNAYLDIINNKTDWLPVGGFDPKISYGFGSDGMRGYIYSSDDDALVIISIKGTSASAFGVGGDDASKRDKLEDNLLFSCCCAAVDRTWRPVCPCCPESNVCNSTCLEEALAMPDSYFNIAMKIRESIEVMYPNADIWFTGHSLGGAVAALAAYASNMPAVAFEAPGDKRYAHVRKLEEIRKSRRKGHSSVTMFQQYIEKTPAAQWEIYPNPTPSSTSHVVQNTQSPMFYNEDDSDSFILPIWHFGISTDPIFTGQCNGVYSSCYIGGYAMETRCHLGNICLLDIPIEDPSEGKTDIRHHRMSYVLEKLEKSIRYLPFCFQEDPMCQDCAGWTYIH